MTTICCCRPHVNNKVQLWYIYFSMAKKPGVSAISDEALYAELGRRRSAARTVFRGGKAPSCICGKCEKCKKRAAMQKYRAKVK